MALLPKVKLKALPTFPSNIIGGVGLTATKANGSLTLDYAWQEFGAINAIPTSPTSYILTYDTASGAYVMVPSHLLGGAVAGIADAPTDGVQYGRQGTAGSMNWTPVAGGTPANTAPIMDSGTTGTIGGSLLYARQDHIHPSDTTRLTDARSDGALYGRQNGTWTAVPAPGISDAPSDGLQYGRQKSGTTMQWTAVAGTSSYVPIYDTRNLAIAATIPLGTTFVRINNYQNSGDGGGFEAFEVPVNSATDPWFFKSNGGTRQWLIVPGQVNPRMFGGIGNGTNSDTIALQACINLAQSGVTVSGKLLTWSVYIPPVPAGQAWRTDAALNITASVAIHGDGMPGTYSQVPGGLATFARQRGSWILFDHTGHGFFISSATNFSEVVIDGIGTCRTQPAPPASGGTFTPTETGWDFWNDSANLTITHCMLLNPTYGVHHGAGSSRLTMMDVRGQPLKTCIEIPACFDSCRLIDIHWWIFWSGAPAVKTWTCNNRHSLRTGHADGLFVNNYFSIFDEFGHDIYPAPGDGTTSNSLIRAKLVNCYFDGCATSLAIDAACQGVIVEYVNFLGAFETTLSPNAHGVSVACNGAELYFTNFELSWAGATGVLVSGSNNRIAIHNPRIHGWDNFSGGSGGWSAYNVGGTNNKIKLTGEIQTIQPTAGRSTAVKGGAHPESITGLLASGYTAASAAAGGTVTVAHGASTTPSHGIANCYGGVSGFIAITSLMNSVDATNVQFLFTNNAGVAATGTATFHWEVHI